MCIRDSNNFNPEWLKTWNANIDVQLALDHFAIITYMVSYISKDETGMTQCLKEALKGHASEPLKERLKCVKLAYLKNRQMGASEAVYRFFPGMAMKKSNIGTVFVQTGFPDHRTIFFKKVIDGVECDDEDNGEEEIEEEFTVSSNEKTVKLKDKDGNYKQGISVHER